MVIADLIITIGEDKQSCCALDTSPKKLDQVECSFISPVDIVQEHDDGSPPRYFL